MLRGVGIAAMTPRFSGAPIKTLAIWGLRYFGVRYRAILEMLCPGSSLFNCICLIASAREHWCCFCTSATLSAIAIFSKRVYTVGRPLPDLVPPRFDADFLGALAVLLLLATVFPVFMMKLKPGRYLKWIFVFDECTKLSRYRNGTATDWRWGWNRKRASLS